MPGTPAQAAPGEAPASAPGATTAAAPGAAPPAAAPGAASAPAAPPAAPPSGLFVERPRRPLRSNKVQIPQIVTPLNYHLAETGLAAMLESAQRDYELQDLNMSVASQHALLLIPVLNRYLLIYGIILDKRLDLTRLRALDAFNKQAPLDSLTTSLRSLQLRGINVAQLVKQSVINSLKVLLSLVQRSPHVRRALINDKYSSLEAERKKPDDKKKDAAEPRKDAEQNAATGGSTVAEPAQPGGAQPETAKTPAANKPVPKAPTTIFSAGSVVSRPKNAPARSIPVKPQNKPEPSTSEQVC